MISPLQGVLAPGTLASVKDLLQASNFSLVHQVRSSHYSHVFSCNDPSIANDSEPYEARFYRLDDTDSHHSLVKLVVPTIAKSFLQQKPDLKYILSPFIVRLDPGCFYRTHIDSYLGEIGMTLFINDSWCWDYGGVISFHEPSSMTSTSYLPVNNSALLRIEDEKPLFHSVSLQTNLSKSSQYLILCWASSEKLPETEDRFYLNIHDFL